VVRFAPLDAAEALAAEALAALEHQPSFGLLWEVKIGQPIDPAIIRRTAVLATLVDAVPASLRTALADELRSMPMGDGNEGISNALILAKHVPPARRSLLQWA
jgi:hypothetical protein